MAKEKMAGRLRLLRAMLGKTQVEFAQDLDTTQANISQMEKDVCVPAGSFMTKLAERFPEVNFNWLVYNEGAPLRRDDSAKLLLEAEKKVEKRMKADFDRLNNELAKVREQNSTLIDLAGKNLKKK